MYVMTTMTLDKDVGIETLNVAIEAIRVSILGKGYVMLFYLLIAIRFFCCSVIAIFASFIFMVVLLFNLFSLVLCCRSVL